MAKENFDLGIKEGDIIRIKNIGHYPSNLILVDKVFDSPKGRSFGIVFIGHDYRPIKGAWMGSFSESTIAEIFINKFIQTDFYEQDKAYKQISLFDLSERGNDDEPSD